MRFSQKRKIWKQKWKMWKRRWEKTELVFTIVLLALIALLLLDAFIRNTIAIVVIEGRLADEEAFNIVRTLDSLEKNPFVRAIVLRVNSPGGTAEAIHEIYYKLLRVKNVKPVVASVDQTAASGAYYLISQSDYIFSKQSSEVGGIGAIVELPRAIEAPDLVASGPFKIEADEESAYRALELLKKDFLEVVKKGRAGKLSIEPTELTAAKLYIGYDAIKLGLIDEIGGTEDAIVKAKELADLPVHRVMYAYPTSSVSSPLYVSPGDITSNTTSSPVFYLLHVKLEE